MEPSPFLLAAVWLFRAVALFSSVWSDGSHGNASRDRIAHRGFSARARIVMIQSGVQQGRNCDRRDRDFFHWPVDFRSSDNAVSASQSPGRSKTEIAVVIVRDFFHWPADCRSSDNTASASQFPERSVGWTIHCRRHGSTARMGVED
jgi:hypothetical protein